MGFKVNGLEDVEIRMIIYKEGHSNVISERLKASTFIIMFNVTIFYFKFFKIIYIYIYIYI